MNQAQIDAAEKAEAEAFSRWLEGQIFATLPKRAKLELMDYVARGLAEHARTLTKLEHLKLENHNLKRALGRRHVENN